MLFSVIVPVYNVAGYLRACVDSVLANDCRDCEIILVDDGSTDGVCPALCDALAAETPEQIRVIHQKNRGLGGARNTGIENAAGDYLFFLDSDDTIAPDCLSILREAVERYAPDIVAFPLAMIPENGDGSVSALQKHCLSAGKAVSLRKVPAMLMDSPSACSRLWRRTLFTDSGIRFPERLWYEDLFTTGKLLLQADRVVGVDAPVYRYLLRGGSIMNNANLARNGEILTALDEILNWYRERGAFDAYEQELCGMALHHICYACVRVLRQDPKHALLQQLTDYLNTHFPDWQKCRYYGTLSGQQRLILRLVRKGRCGLAAGLFRLNDTLHRR